MYLLWKPRPQTLRYSRSVSAALVFFCGFERLKRRTPFVFLSSCVCTQAVSYNTRLLLMHSVTDTGRRRWDAETVADGTKCDVFFRQKPQRSLPDCRIWSRHTSWQRVRRTRVSVHHCVFHRCTKLQWYAIVALFNSKHRQSATLL